MENTISILIVEDEEIWIQSLTMILEDFGYRISGVATTVNEALVAFGAMDYDLVLMDINLDSMTSGIELGKVVNKMYHKPFIFVTSSNDHNFRDAAQANPSAYLTKPVNASSLFIAIQNAIKNFTDGVPASLNRAGDESFTSFFVKHGSKYKKIDWKDVAYLSAGKNYVSIFNTVDKMDFYIRSSLHKTLQHIIPRQLQSQFIQLNRSDVVQFSFISEVTADEVKTAYKCFPVSEAFGKELRSKLRIIS